MFAQLSGTTKFWKRWPKKSENILEYYQKSEIIFICIFIIKNDLNMLKITGGLKNDCPNIWDNQISTEHAPNPVFD